MHPRTLRLLFLVPNIDNISATSGSITRVAELKAQKSISLIELDLWKKTNCTILGIKEDVNKYILNPPSTYILQAGERLIVMGSDEQITEAKKIV